MRRDQQRQLPESPALGFGTSESFKLVVGWEGPRAGSAVLAF